MLFWVQISLAFVAGIIWSKFWSNLVYSGFSIIMMKKTQLECLKIMDHVNTSMELAMDMKYKHLEKAEFSERNLEGERRLDQHVLNGMRNNMVSTLVVSIPRSHLNIAKYDDWESAIKFLKENK